MKYGLQDLWTAASNIKKDREISYLLKYYVTIGSRNDLVPNSECTLKVYTGCK